MTTVRNAYHRKKQPEIVRRDLIEQATRLMVQEGLQAVTVQAVADAAGVSKGGFMHHFSSKQALLETMVKDLLDALNSDITARIAADPEPVGAFTRAYIESVFELGGHEASSPWAVLSITSLADAELRTLWTEWYNQCVSQYRQTDSALHLTALRLAADGVWLSDLVNTTLLERDLLRQHLIQATYLTE